MEQTNGTPAEENIVSDIYEGYHEIKKEILAIETRKASIKLFTVAAVLLFFNLLAVITSGVPFSYVWFDTLLLPVLFTGLGFLSFKEPYVASISGMVLMFGIWIYNAIVWDILFLVQGWLWKGLIIYLLFAGFQNAREAHRARRDLRS